MSQFCYENSFDSWTSLWGYRDSPRGPWITFLEPMKEVILRGSQVVHIEGVTLKGIMIMRCNSMWQMLERQLPRARCHVEELRCVQYMNERNKSLLVDFLLCRSVDFWSEKDRQISEFVANFHNKCSYRKLREALYCWFLKPHLMF